MTYQAILDAKVTYPPGTAVSAEAKDLISKLLQRDPTKRITLDGVLEHPWVKKYAVAKPVLQPSPATTAAVGENKPLV